MKAKKPRYNFMKRQEYGSDAKESKRNLNTPETNMNI